MEFYKYQGTGNDFVMVDNRLQNFNTDTAYIENLCDRRFGIGADGLILLEHDETNDFKMVYFNSDGRESTMCGNGGRCLVAFAHFLGIFEKKCTFNAIDGLHEAEIKDGIVKLKMIDVPTICYDGTDAVLNTGSPHYVKMVSHLENYNVYEEGNKIRNSATYAKEGINVNFVEELPNQSLYVRTYERGVEDETLSCGTGVTASALSYMKGKNMKEVNVKVLGGQLKIYADQNNDSFTNVWLEGPATQVFKGNI